MKELVDTITSTPAVISSLLIGIIILGGYYLISRYCRKKSIKFKPNFITGTLSFVGYACFVYGVCNLPNVLRDAIL